MTRLIFLILIFLALILPTYADIRGFPYSVADNRYWTISSDQVGITGDKSGSFDLTTTGNILTQSGGLFKTYDASNVDYIQLYHDGADGLLYTNAGDITLFTSSDVNALLADSSGATYFRVQDSGVNTVFSVNSDGNGLFTGTLGAGAITGTSFVVGAYSLSTEFQWLDGIAGYIYRDGGTDVPVDDGGTGRSSDTAYALISGGTTTTAAQTSIANSATVGAVLMSAGTSAYPAYNTGLVYVSPTLTIGVGGAVDYGITFNGATTDGVFNWQGGVAEDYFLFSDDIVLADNEELFAGGGKDFELYHNGTDSYIQNNTGDIYIENDASNGDIFFKINDGGIDKTIMQIYGTLGYIGIGTGVGYTVLPNRLFHVEELTALTTTVVYPFRLAHITSATPDNGIGIGIEFEQETTANNNEVIGTFEAVVTDKTATSEDAAFVWKLMTAGAAATEKLRVTSLGAVVLAGVTADPTSPADGSIWFRSDTNEFRVQANSVTYKLLVEIP